MEEWQRRQTMTKTLEEQIEEARDDLAFQRGDSLIMGWTTERVDAAVKRAEDRAASRLATLEAVRDGRMIEVYATVAVDTGMPRGWASFGSHAHGPLDDAILDAALNRWPADKITILRGYAHVPSTQVHEVEADSEVVL